MSSLTGHLSMIRFKSGIHITVSVLSASVHTNRLPSLWLLKYRAVYYVCLIFGCHLNMDQKSYFSPSTGSHAPPQSSGDREDQPRFGLCSLVACPGWSVCPVHPLVCSTRPSARRSPSLLSQREGHVVQVLLWAQRVQEREACVYILLLLLKDSYCLLVFYCLQ